MKNAAHTAPTSEVHAPMLAITWLGRLLGLQYLFSKDPSAKIPPIVLIATTIAIDGLFGMIAGAWFLITLLIQWIDPAISFNVLMEKNLVFFFGHVVANVTLYFVVGCIHEMMPHFTGQSSNRRERQLLSLNRSQPPDKSSIRIMALIRKSDKGHVGSPIQRSR
ncbi:MAG: hypothetical protein ACREUL_19460 [Steroidobacteraceae bacterium]